MSDSKSPFRRIVAAPPQAQVIATHSKADFRLLLEDSLSIAQVEILKLKKKSNATIGGLTPTEANVLQGYMKTLIGMAKEVREREKEADEQLSNMSPEELVQALEAELENARKQAGIK